MYGLRLLPARFYPRPMAAARSMQGLREENQDNYLLIDGDGWAQSLRDDRPYRRRLTAWPKGHWRLCIFDGMGGHVGGKAFAADAVESLLAEPFAPRSASRRRERLYAIHQALYERHHQGPRSPGSTLIWVDIHPDGTLRLLNLGDSRAWLCRDERWKMLTHDHTEAEFLWRDGDPPREVVPSHVIAQALGFGSFGLMHDADGNKPLRLSSRLRLDLPGEGRGHADLITLPLRRGDLLLLASDGLWSGDAGDEGPEKLMVGMERDAPEDQVRNLLLAALERGADDNLTAILCRMV